MTRVFSSRPSRVGQPQQVVHHVVLESFARFERRAPLGGVVLVEEQATNASLRGPMVLRETPSMS